MYHLFITSGFVGAKILRGLNDGTKVKLVDSSVGEKGRNR
jgi:hypothetical protein